MACSYAQNKDNTISRKFPDYTGGCFECSTYHIMAQSRLKEEMKERRRKEEREGKQMSLHSIC